MLDFTVYSIQLRLRKITYRYRLSKGLKFKVALSSCVYFTVSHFFKCLWPCEIKGMTIVNWFRGVWIIKKETDKRTRGRESSQSTSNKIKKKRQLQVWTIRYTVYIWLINVRKLNHTGFWCIVDKRIEKLNSQHTPLDARIVLELQSKIRGIIYNWAKLNQIRDWHTHSHTEG